MTRPKLSLMMATGKAEMKGAMKMMIIEAIVIAAIITAITATTFAAVVYVNS